MTRNGTAYQLAPLAPLTGGTGFGLLPTPAATPYGSSQNGINGIGGEFERPSARTPSLATMAKKGLLPERIPTPTAGDAKASGSRNLPGSRAHPGVSLTDYVKHGNSSTPRRELLPTPVSNDAQRSTAGPADGKRGASLADRARLWPTPKSVVSGPDYARTSRPRSGGDDLATAVARAESWPTPNSRDWKDSGAKQGARKSPNLGTAVHRAGDEPESPARTGGQLNPTFVEWLMGFPLGWTVLEPSEIPSSRRSRNGSGGGS